MKLGVIAANLMHYEFEEGLRRAQELGFQAIEVGAAGLLPRKHCDPKTLLTSKERIDEWLGIFARYDLEISALAAHGTPLSPDPEVASTFSHEFRLACELGEKANIKLMTLLAGLPEGAEGDRAPNWVSFAEWPFLRDTLEWQWEKRVIPFWRKHAKIAEDHGITLCFEMHGGDVVHNPITLMRLHDAVGGAVACNVDFAHLWYQGIDPIEAIRFLGPLVRHVHAKDTLIHKHNARLRGLTDSGTPEHPETRAWTYTLPGWGHGAATWREIIATLRLIGYDHVISVEMESEYFDVEEGLEKTAAFLKPMILKRPPSTKWWELAGWARSGGLGAERTGD
jgi:sugar phosphate isomerase/epimerase